MRHLYNECLRTGTFPQVWKKASIVLIPKEGKHKEPPSAYRPICLLDEAGKILERVIAARLVHHLSREGPNLNERQYGFRAGRSTVDAISQVRSVSQAVTREGGVLLTVSLDILNAFNTLPWHRVGEALQYHRVPPYLVSIVANYFRDRQLAYVDRNAEEQSGGDIWGEAVAPQKIEAVFFHKRKIGAPPKTTITVENTPIEVGTQIKYLGFHLNGKWTFGEHFRRITPKVDRAAMALCRLLPNLGGPDERVRRLYAGTVHAMIMYGAPVWAEKLEATRKLKDSLHQLQRRVANRICRGFRTVSWTAAGVLSGVPPIELLARMYTEVYKRMCGLQKEGIIVTDSIRRNLRVHTRRRLIEDWSRKLENPSLPRQRTVGAIKPCLEQRLGRANRGVTYRMTQVLTGHGCFGEYLNRIGKERTTRCHHCGYQWDTAQHTLENCVAWAGERVELVATIGRDLSLPAIVQKIAGSKKAWKSFSSYCERVMQQKEKKRDREREGEKRREWEEGEVVDNNNDEEKESNQHTDGGVPPLFLAPAADNHLSGGGVGGWGGHAPIISASDIDAG
ncbi:uncharacterized protein LOC114929630 [Nylanderia fulva]|uniref:uncharacterized protein LOC114929630 n=1 Tax=Nylanderia fulva TaxID=613905 RepID=UPI0010FB3EC1|nr:uncharacterized protein LOC114929630 [Nylanderia fulva]